MHFQDEFVNLNENLWISSWNAKNTFVQRKWLWFYLKRSWMLLNIPYLFSIYFKRNAIYENQMPLCYLKKEIESPSLVCSNLQTLRKGAPALIEFELPVLIPWRIVLPGIVRNIGPPESPWSPLTFDGFIDVQMHGLSNCL